MLTRIYVHNYRALVNFELRLGREQLFLGRNGTGKTTVFDVLDAVVRFAAGDGSIDELFPKKSKSRLLADDQRWQEFEIDITDAGDGLTGETARYRLVIEQDLQRDQRRVIEESVFLGSSVLFSYTQHEALLYRDDGARGLTYLADWSRSSLPSIPERKDGTKLTAVKARLARIRVASPDPRAMRAVSEREESSPRRDLSNVASWYRHLLQEDSECTERVLSALRASLDGFYTLDLTRTDDGPRRLDTRWRKNDAAKPITFALDELSDGQRVLLALTMLANESEDTDTTLLIDEPDNYVALSEIQPLLMAMRDRDNLQLIVISHHPEIINLQALEHGLVFEREQLGPTRVRKFEPDAQSILTAAEIVARGEE